MAIQQNFQQLVQSAGSAEDALKKLAQAQKEADFAKLKPGLLQGAAGLDDLKKKLEEVTPAAQKAGNALQGLRSQGRILSMAGRVGHIHELKALGGELRLVSMLAGAMSPPMLLAAAGVVAVGAAAVLASDSLQEKLGKALFITKEQAEATEKAMRKLQERGEQIRLARSLGGGTLEESQRVRALAGAEAPHIVRQQQALRDQASAGARAEALMRFPDQAFSPTHNDLEKLHAEALDRGGADRSRDQSHLLDPNALMALAQQPFQTPGLLARQQFENQAAMGAERQTNTGLRQERSDRLRFQQITEEQAKSAQAQNRLREIDKEMEANWKKLQGGQGTELFQAMGLVKSDDKLRTAQHSLALERDKLEKQEKASTPRLQALLREKQGLGLGDDAAKNAERLLTIDKELEQSNDRLRKTQEDSLRIKQQIAQTDIGNLKTIQATVAEQLKAAAAERRQAEDKLRGSKIELGGMDKRDLRQVQQLANRLDEAMKGGRELSRGELQAAGRFNVLREKTEQYNLQQAEKDPAIAALNKQLGLDKKVADAKQAEQALGKLDVDLKTQIQAKVDLNSKEMADQIKNELVPIITQAFQDAVQAAAQAVGAVVRDMALKEQAQAQAQARAALNAGGKGGG